MASGIYVIEHVDSGKRYVGSAVEFSRRFEEHQRLLRRRAHHSPYLQRAWLKHGEDAFLFKRLLMCAPKDLLYYEQRAIDAFGEYNVCPVAGSRLGARHTPAALAKMSAAHKGRHMSAEWCAKISASNTGKVMSAEVRRRIGVGNTGKVRSADVRERIREALIGRSIPISVREANPAYKLNTEKVQTIRRLLAEGVSQRRIASIVGAHHATVNDVARGKSWRDV